MQTWLPATCSPNALVAPSHVCATKMDSMLAMTPTYAPCSEPPRLDRWFSRFSRCSMRSFSASRSDMISSCFAGAIFRNSRDLTLVSIVSYSRSSLRGA